MSALTNFLQQYSSDISARQEHQNDTDNAVAERKANTLEEKFQHAKDAIETAGAELGGAGAAFHLGRKIYRQVQARRAARAQETSKSNSNATDQQTRGADGSGDTPVNPEDKPGTAPPQGEGTDPITETDTFFPDRPTSNFDADNVFRDDPGNLQLKARQKAQAAEEGRDPATATDPAAEAHGGADAPATETSDPGTLQGVNDRAAATQDRIGNDVPDDTGSTPDFMNTRAATPLKESPSTTSSGANDAPSSRAATEQPEAQPDLPDAPNPTGASTRAATNSAEQVAADGKSAIADDGANALKSVGTKVAQKVGTSGALEGIGDALDFLGPIGEGLGIITSLVGLFEGLGHKQEDPDADVQKAQQTGQFAPGSVGTGFDIKGLTDQPTGALTATY